MRTSKEKLSLFRRVFRGRDDAYGYGAGKCIKKPVTNAVITSHLKGAERIGQYPLSPAIMGGSGVFWVAADIDSHGATGLLAFNDKHDTILTANYAVKLMTNKANELGVVPYTERSKSGDGCHVFLFFADAVEAIKGISLMRCLCDHVEQETGFSITEIFPKQSRLDASTSFGNYINLPLNGRAAVTQGFTAFFDPATGEAYSDQWELLSQICDNMTKADFLDMLIESGDVPIISTVVDKAGHTRVAGINYAAIIRGELSDSIGGRTDHLVRLAGHWWQMGIYVEEAVELGIAWDIRNDLGLDTDPQYFKQFGSLGKIEGTIRDIYRRNDAKVETVDQVVEKQSGLIPIESAYVTGYKEVIKAGSKRRVQLRPLPDINRALGAMRPCDVGIILARPAVGKSFLGQTIAHDVALHQKMKVAYISMEMTEEGLIERAAAMLTSWDSKVIANMAMDDEDETIIYRLNEYAGSFLIATNGTYTLDKIRELLEAEPDVGLVVLDYLSLITGTGKSIYERTSSVARGLKVLAKETNTAVLCLSQVSRAGIDGEPITLNMGRDSGAIEEGADWIIGIWSDELPGVTKTIQARLLKNRRGISGITQTMLFKNNMLVAMQEERGQHGSDTSD